MSCLLPPRGTVVRHAVDEVAECNARLGLQFTFVGTRKTARREYCYIAVKHVKPTAPPEDDLEAFGQELVGMAGQEGDEYGIGEPISKTTFCRLFTWDGK